MSSRSLKRRAVVTLVGRGAEGAFVLWQMPQWRCLAASNASPSSLDLDFPNWCVVDESLLHPVRGSCGKVRSH